MVIGGRRKAKNTGIFFVYASTQLIVKEEAELYPLNSFIAEVGGALGLFFGFSFVGLWNLFLSMIVFFTGKCVKINSCV